MLRLALIGNCQVQSLSMLTHRMLAPRELRVLDYSTAASRDEATRQRFADGLGEMDFIFCQTALLSHTNERDLRARYGAKVVTIANFYFRGLFPDSCNVGDFANRLTEPTSLHSLLVLDAYRRGLSEPEAVWSFSLGNLDRLGLLDAWASSMAELRRREAGGVVDLPAADFIEQACKSYPAFLTMNHPSAVLLADYLQLVFRHAGLPAAGLNAAALPDPLQVLDTTPILDEVADYLNLPYRTPQRWNIRALGHVSREEFVYRAYAAYRGVAAERLLVHSPMDLVVALREDPRRAYLVEAGIAAPEGEARRPAPGAADGQGDLAALNQTVQSLTRAVEENRYYIHRMYGYLNVMDPKVERLNHLVPRLVEQTRRRRRVEVVGVVKGVARRLMRLLRLSR